MLTYFKGFLSAEPSRYARVEAPAMIGIPIVSVVALTVVGMGLEQAGVVKGFYASPFVLLSALIANRVCIMSGMIAATLGAIAFNLEFVAPKHALTTPTMEELLAYLSMFVAAGAVARRVPAEPQKKTHTHEGELPFIDNHSERKFWSIRATGIWGDDCQVGEVYGRMFIDATKTKRTSVGLGWIIESMIREGKFTGVEAGFASEVQRSIAHDNAKDSRLH